MIKILKNFFFFFLLYKITHGDFLNKKIDILFISHYLNKSQIGHKEDFYFGNLPYDIKKYGYKSLIALINHTGVEADFLSNNWNYKQKIPRVILSKTINFYSSHYTHNYSIFLKFIFNSNTNILIVFWLNS